MNTTALVRINMVRVNCVLFLHLYITVGINSRFYAVYTVLYPRFSLCGLKWGTIIIKYFPTLKLFRIFAK